MASYQDFFFNLLRKQKAPSDVADAAIVKATPITAQEAEFEERKSKSLKVV